MKNTRNDHPTTASCFALIPSRKQWKSWSLPSRLTAIGALLGVISLGLYMAEKFYSLSDHVFGKRSPNTTVSSTGQTGGITAQTVVIMQPSAADKKPTLFSMNDPSLILVRKYLIPKHVGTTFAIGENCPSAPCFLVKLVRVNLDKSPPSIHFSIGGEWDGIHQPNARGIGLHPTLKEGCGFKFRSGYYDLVFEIISDRATNLEAWGAVFAGTLEKGSFSAQGICP